MSRHVVRQHDFVNQNKSLDDFSDRLICSVEHNAGVISDATRHTQKVLIAGYDHPSFSSRKVKMDFIILRSQAGLVRRRYVNASTTKSHSDCRIDVLIKVETDAFSHGRARAAFLSDVTGFSS